MLKLYLLHKGNILQILFIDESGTIPPKNRQTDNGYFALGGVIIPEDIWHKVDKQLSLIKKDYGIIGEIKWRFFATQKKDTNVTTPLSHLTPESKDKLRLELFELLKRFRSIRSICAIVEIDKAYKLQFINDDKDLYWYAYKQVTERFQYYLQDLSRTVSSNINGLIVCDHRDRKNDDKLRHLHQKLMVGSKAHSSQYKNLIEGVFIVPSHLSVGIQFADLIAGSIFRKFASNDNRFFEIIKPLIRTNSNGEIEGYGLIKWPKD